MKFTVTFRTVLLLLCAGIGGILMLTAVPMAVGWSQSIVKVSSVSETTIEKYSDGFRSGILATSTVSIYSFLDRLLSTSRSLITWIENQGLLPLDSNKTARDLCKELLPFVNSLPDFEIGYTSAVLWEDTHHHQHFLRIIPWLKSYGVWDRDTTINFTYWDYVGFNMTDHLSISFNLAGLDGRPFWDMAHTASYYVSGSRAIWTAPFWSITPNEGKLISVTELPTQFTDVTNRVSWITFTGYTVAGIQQYMSTINVTAHGFAFLVYGSDLFLLASSKSGVVPVATTFSPASLSPDDVTRQVAEDFLRSYNGTNSISFSLSTNPDLLVDTSLVALAGGGVVYRLFLVTPQSDFLSSLTSARDDANNIATGLLAGIISFQFVVLFVAILCTGIFAMQIWTPLNRVCQQIKSVANMDLPKLLKTKDERSDVAHSLSHLREVQDLEIEAERMKTVIGAFAHYIPHGIVKQIVHDSSWTPELQMVKTEATVLFLDLVEFTRMTESLGSKHMLSIMGELFGAFTDIIESNEGVVDKFIGDAIMAVWGVPDPVDKPVQKACIAIAQIQNALANFNIEQEKKGSSVKMRIRIGLDHGHLYSGNVGCPRRMNYTVIGSTVNLASRLEQLGKRYGSSTILVSDRIRAKCSADDCELPFLLRCLGYAVVKGFSKPVRIHEFLGHRSFLSPEKLHIYQEYQHVDEVLMSSASSSNHAIQEAMEEYCNRPSASSDIVGMAALHVTRNDPESLCLTGDNPTSSLGSTSPMM